MYPSPEVLQEIGRVTIAGARLDVAMGMLWQHLDRDVDLRVARAAPAQRQSDQVRRLAGNRLTGDLRQAVIAAVDAADTARSHRNGVIHQDWVLRGRDAFRPVSELADVRPEDLPAYFEAWEREAKESKDWQRVPSRSVEVVPAPTLEQLRDVERELAAATQRVASLTFAVASARETGKPPGYVHPR